MLMLGIAIRTKKVFGTTYQFRDVIDCLFLREKEHAQQRYVWVQIINRLNPDSGSGRHRKQHWIRESEFERLIHNVSIRKWF